MSATKLAAENAVLRQKVHLLEDAIRIYREQAKAADALILKLAEQHDELAELRAAA